MFELVKAIILIPLLILAAAGLVYHIGFHIYLIREMIELYW